MLAPKKKKLVERSILGITDFTKSSTNAVLFAANLLKNTAIKLKLLNVYETPTEKATLLISVDDILTQDSESGLKKQTTEITSGLKNITPDISTYSISGKLKKAISSIMQAENIDLIVAGTPSNKYTAKILNDTPILFMGQSRYPVLIVPEKHTTARVKNILILNMGSGPSKNMDSKGLEEIINHDHISKKIINLNEKKMDSGSLQLIHDSLSDKKTDLIILNPAPGDRIDKALLEYEVRELYPTIDLLLKY